MAAAKNYSLLFNEKEITEAEALARLGKIYGGTRAPEIIAGLADGRHRCASVEGGYIELTLLEKETPPASAPESPV